MPASPDSSTVLEQVLIARYLFREGERALDSHLPYSQGLAVSLFQDAAELALAAVAIAVNAKVADRMAFLGYWDAIEQAPGNADKKHVPSKAALSRLNTARVSFKHHGQRPHADDVANFRRDCELFLRELVDRFLGVDLDEISLASLIADETIRGQVSEAERYFADGNWGELFKSCALAVHGLLESVKQGIPRVVPLPDIRWDALGDREGRALQSVIKSLESQLALHKAMLLILQTGTSLPRYARFQRSVPGVRVTLGGVPQVFPRPTTEPPDEEQQRADGRFCIDFVVDLALRVQSQRV